MLDLQGFLEAYRREAHLHVLKPGPARATSGPSIAQAAETIVFENLVGVIPGFRPGGQSVRRPQGPRRESLRLQPAQVVPSLAQVLKREPAAARRGGRGGPCHDRVFTGEDVDLANCRSCGIPSSTRIPYTTSFAVHHDPETGLITPCTRACGVLGPSEMVTSFVTPTANRILAAHRAAGTRHAAGRRHRRSSSLGAGGVLFAPARRLVELELFEAITGKPGVVTRCKTVDLMVPADASIVIEGHVSPTRTAQDGPSPDRRCSSRLMRQSSRCSR